MSFTAPMLRDLVIAGLLAAVVVAALAIFGGMSCASC